MSKVEKRENSMHVVGAGGYEQMLEQLLAALGPYHKQDTELHQLFLETQWLFTNQQSGTIALPRWELLIFKMISGSKLRQYPEVRQSALRLVPILQRLANGDDQLAG